MATYEVTGPDGQKYNVDGPDGASKEEVLAVLQQHLATNPPPPPDSGFIPALKAGAADTQAGLAALGARLGLRDEEGAQQDINALHQYSQRTFKPSTWSESPFSKFKETVGSSLPAMAGLAGAGVVGTATAGPVGGFAATAGLDALLRTGSNLQGQMAQGRSLGDTNLGAAALTAIPQAALETGAMAMIPGVRGIFGSLGHELTNAQAMQIAKQSASQALADLAGKGALAAGEQGVMQVANTALERLQAGASMSDPEARNAYLESLLGGASFGLVAGAAGRGFERHGANTLNAALEAKQKADKLDQDLLAAKQQADAEAAQKQTPEYLQQVQDDWDAAQKQRQTLMDARKGLDKTDPFYKDDYADASKALAEYLKSPDYQNAYSAYRDARPQLERAQRQQGSMMDMAPIEGEGMQPANGQWSTQAPEESAPSPLDQYVQDQMTAATGPTGMQPSMTRTVQHLMQQPDMARQMVAQNYRIPGTKPGQSQALLSAMKLQLAAQDKAAAAQSKAELAQRTQDFSDQTQPTVEQNPMADYDATRQEFEQNPGEPGAYLEAPPMDDVWQQALAGKEPSPTMEGVPQGMMPVPNAGMLRQRINDLYDQHAAASNAYEMASRSGDKEGAASALEQREQARQQLDQFRNEPPAGELTKDLKRPKQPVQTAPDYGREVVKARDEQQQALADYQSTTNDIANGLYIGGAQNDLGGSTRAMLEQRAQDAKARFISASLKEAAIHHAAEGKELPTDKATIFASRANDMLDNWHNAKTQHLDEMEDYTSGMGQDHAPAPNPLDNENRRSGLLPEEAANMQARMGELREQMLDLPDNDPQREVLQARVSQMAQQLARHIEGNGEAVTPRQNPLPQARRPGTMEHLAAMHKALIEPPNKAQRVDTSGPYGIRSQFPKVEEAKRQAESGAGDQSLRRRVEYVANEVDHALARKDLPQPVRTTLEKVKEAIEAGHVTRDLLDEVDHLAERAQHGQGVHAADLRNIQELQKLAHDVHGLDFRENTKELPGMEPTATAKGTPEEFRNLPQFKALDKAKRETAAAQERLNQTRTFLQDKLAEHEHTAGSARQQFLRLRGLAASAWKQYQKEWHFGDQIKETSARLRDMEEALRRQEQRRALHAEDTDSEIFRRQNERVTALRDDVEATRGQLESLHRQAGDMLDKFDANARAMLDDHVAQAKAKLDKAEQRLEEVRTHNEQARAPHARMELVKARMAYDEARRQSDMLGREAKARKDAWESKLQRGLELPGRRHTEGRTEQILSGTAQRAVDERRQAEERRRADQELAERAEKGETSKGVRRVAGPVARPKKGGGKSLSEARVWDHPFTKRETPNETAERLKGQPGTALRTDEGTLKRNEREALMTQFRAAKTPAEKAAIAQKVRGLDQEIKALDKAAEQERLKGDKNARKERRIANKERKTIKAMVRTGKRHAEDSRSMRAVEDQDFAESLEEAERSPFDFHKRRDGTGAEYAQHVENATNGSSYDTTHPLHGKTFVEAARFAVGRIEDPQLRAVAQKMVAIFSKMPDTFKGEVRAVRGYLNNPDGSTGDGAYIPHMHTVLLSDQAPASTVVHELVHAATVHELRTNPKLRGEIKELVARARDHLLKQGKTEDELPYGLTNEREFVAETLSDADFQNTLREIPYEGQRGKPKMSAWAKFVNVLSSIFNMRGGPKITDNMLERAIALSEKAMDGTVRDIAPNLPTHADLGELDLHKHTTSEIVGHEPGLLERWGDHLGLRLAQNIVDKQRPVENVSNAALKEGKITADQWLKGNYYLRMGDNTSNFMAQAITNGPNKIVTDDLGNGRKQTRIESQEGPTAQKAAVATREGATALGWTPEKGETVLTVLMAGDRANAIPDGWDRLSGENAAKAKAEWQQYKQALDTNPQAKKAFDEAKRQMKGFFDGNINFAAQAGSISKEEAKRLTSLPYVPFVREKNGVLSLLDANEKPIRIGNIKDQPELMQLLGSEKKIQPIFTSAIQNAYMLHSMALHNKATMETGYMLHSLGAATNIGKGRGPEDPNTTIHWKENGADHFAIVDKDMFGVPAAMIVRGMEGIKTQFPAIMKLMGIPSDWLRKFVTRNPAYALRQLLRDPANAYILGGVDGMPFLNAAKHLKDMQYGNSEAEHALMRGGAISSNVMTHNARDIDGYLRSIAQGKQEGWRGLLQRADRLALEADAATRAAIYEDSIKKGFTEAEAQFRAMESMNFNRRGLSPSMHMLSTVIPFFNAQLQGLDVLWRSMKGTMPFAKRLDIQHKLVTRGATLAGIATLYSLAMQTDDAYRKMKPAERYQNFVVRIPGMHDLVKIPIPYEVGVLFKAIPEAIIDAASRDTKVGEAVRGLGTVALTSTPNLAPAAIWPIIEAMYGKTLYGDIETQREKQFAPSERWRDSTSEIAKAAGKYTGDMHLGDSQMGISPIMLEHFVRGYTGSLGVGLLHVLDPVMADASVQRPSKTEADTPGVGALFQRSDGKFIIDRAYDRMQHIMEVKATYDQMMKEGRRADALRYAQDQSNLIAAVPLAQAFKSSMSAAVTQERGVRMAPGLSTETKDARLKAIRDFQNQKSQDFYAAAEKTTGPARR